MANFTINGIPYQSKLLPGETQVLISKRLMPAFSALSGTASTLARFLPTSDERPDLSRAAEVLTPVARELAKLSDQDVAFIMNSCMDVTTRQVATGVGWVPVRQNGVIQDQSDDSFASRLKITGHVLQENFSRIAGFIGLDVAGLSPDG